MFQDDIDICMACIKSVPPILNDIIGRQDEILAKQEAAIMQLRWLFVANCLIAITVVLTAFVR